MESWVSRRVLFGADGDNFHSSDERVDLDSGLEVALSINQFISEVLCDQEGKNER